MTIDRASRCIASARVPRYSDNSLTGERSPRDSQRASLARVPVVVRPTAPHRLRLDMATVETVERRDSLWTRVGPSPICVVG